MRIWTLPLLALGLVGCEPKTPVAQTQLPTTSPAAAEEQMSVSAEILPAPSSEAPDSPLPADVAAFVDRRDVCDHWRGEYAFDEERGKEIIAAAAEFCTGSDAKLATLRKTYKDNAAVMAALADYEDKIERVP